MAYEFASRLETFPNYRKFETVSYTHLTLPTNSRV